MTTVKAISFEKKTIAIHHLMMAMKCTFAALASKERIMAAELARSETQTVNTVLGVASHKLVAGTKPNDLMNILRAEAPGMSDESLLELVAQAEVVATSMKARRKNSGVDVREEKTVFWKDSLTGWEIASQPDRVESCRDEKGEYIKITELKFPKVVRERHIETVRLFGMICYMLLHAQGVRDIRIKLVVETMQEHNTHTEWMDSHEHVAPLLARVRQTLKTMEAAQQSNGVPPRTTGNHCFGCKLREQCNQGRKYIARTESELEAARLIREERDARRARRCNEASLQKAA